MEYPSLLTDEILLDAARTIVDRYVRFTSPDSGWRFYDSGAVPRWAIIGTVEPSRIEAFDILESAGVFEAQGMGTYAQVSSLDELLGENRSRQDS